MEENHTFGKRTANDEFYFSFLKRKKRSTNGFSLLIIFRFVLNNKPTCSSLSTTIHSAVMYSMVNNFETKIQNIPLDIRTLATDNNIDHRVWTLMNMLRALNERFFSTSVRCGWTLLFTVASTVKCLGCFQVCAFLSPNQLCSKTTFVTLLSTADEICFNAKNIQKTTVTLTTTTIKSFQNTK